MDPVEHVIEQVWAPALSDTRVRVVLNPRPDSAWGDVERYWLVPDASRARLLLPCRPRAAAVGLLLNYRRLRDPRTQAARVVLAGLVRTGLPAGRDVVAVQVRRDAPGMAASLALSRITEVVGGPVVAAIGVRTGDNRKATLQLADPAGRPVGYAKVGWNGPSDEMVATEARALAQLNGGSGSVQVPRLLGTTQVHGHGVTISAALPLTASTSRSARPALTSTELADLSPVVRHGPVGQTGQFRALRARLRALRDAPLVAELVGRAEGLADLVEGDVRSLAVLARWHGDFSPWNTARDEHGRLWVWDWENSEDDAVTGLDALHWAAGCLRLADEDPGTTPLSSYVDVARHHLDALGVARPVRVLVAATYALSVAERAATLAASAGSWSDAFLRPSSLQRLLTEATTALG